MQQLRKALAVMVTAAAVLMPATARAQDVMDRIVERGELRVGVQAQGEPVSFINRDGKRVGLAIDIVTHMAADLKVKLVLREYDWKGLVPALLADKFDFIAADMTPTPERAAALLFSRPIFYQDTVAFAAKGKPFEKWQDLNAAGVSVGGVQGGTYVTTARKSLPRATVKEFASGPATAQAVSSGRIDAAVSSAGNVHGFVAGFDNLVQLKGTIGREPLAFAMRKDSVQLKFWLDNYIDLVTADRRLEGWLDYWWTSNRWHKDHK